MLANQVHVGMDNVRDIMALSAEKLVIFDFWADWCEPCKQLMPVLEKLAAEYPDDLVLAKINCDAEQQLAMHFGVRSLPTVLLIKDGQPVDGFAGVESEPQIRARLEPHLPSPAERLFLQAVSLVESQQWSEAYPLLRDAFSLAPEQMQIRLYFALTCASLGQIPQAEELIAAVKLADQDALYHQVKSLIELAQQAADSPEIRALEAQLAAAPDDMLLQQQLAVQYQAVQRSADALALLFAIVQRDQQFGEAKKLLLDILAILPKGDPLAGQYRRKLYSLLY